MKNQFKVIQVGLGPMGQIVTKLLLKRENINLLGAVDIDPKLENRKLGELLNLDEDAEVHIKSNLESVLSREKADVVIIATASSLEKVAPTIKQAIKSGSNVISLCEELSYPFPYYPELSKELDKLAKVNGVSIVGTGINPGYLMDLLPIVLTGPAQTVESIKVTRMMNSSHRREPFQRKIGTGLSPEEFHHKISKKEITGHVGLPQSIQMIVAALGMEHDEIVEFPPKEIISEKEFTTSYGEIVPKGSVCGLQSTAVAKKNGIAIVTLDFIAYAGDHDEYDSVVIEGTPRIIQKIEGGVHGDLGTAAMVVNLIPKIIIAQPGLLTMKDLPVPCNTENIWKTQD